MAFLTGRGTGYLAREVPVGKGFGTDITVEVQRSGVVFGSFGRIYPDGSPLEDEVQATMRMMQEHQRTPNGGSSPERGSIKFN